MVRASTSPALPPPHRSDEAALSVGEEGALLLLSQDVASTTRARPLGEIRCQHELVKEGPARQRHIG